MLRFLFLHIRSHLFRSVSMIFVSLICMSVMIFLLFIYTNVVGVLSYYNRSIVDEHRFVIQSEGNFFTIFSKKSSWLPDSLVTSLKSSDKIHKIQAFTLVELPVLANFSLFSFWLESDIPVFAVTDSILTWASIPVGLSRSMIDFYNLQFAGSSPMFPRVTESFLIGQSVDVTIGASKIFPSLPKIANGLKWTISYIGDDFPGFGIVLPESVIRNSMKEIGYTLGNPYKIVAYLKDTSDIEIIRSTYNQYNLRFDRDGFREFEQKINIIRNVYLGISLFLGGVLVIFFMFLVFSFFRERRDVFRIVYIFGLRWMRSRLLTLSEPILLYCIGSWLGIILAIFSIKYSITVGNQILVDRWILYQLTSLDAYYMVLIYWIVSCLYIIWICISEWIWRNKSLMR